MSPTSTETLCDDVRRVLADVEGVVKKSEDRAAFRSQHGRDLSKAHKEALGELANALGALSERLTALLEPVPDPESLRRDFEAACRRLEEMT